MTTVHETSNKELVRRFHTWNAVVVGVLVVAVAIWALAARFAATAEYINALLGAWLLVSPFVLGFAGLTVAAWNAWILGACVVALALWAVPSAREAKIRAEA